MLGSVITAAGVLVTGTVSRNNPSLAILSDLKEHLNHARSGLINRRWADGLAHSEATLVGGNFRYTVVVTDTSAEVGAQYRTAIESSLRTWEQELPGVSFQEAVTSQPAHVQFVIRPSVTAKVNHAGGYSWWSRTVKTDGFSIAECEFKATVELATKLPGGATMNSSQMTHVVLHEVGHLLGLDESSREGEVMGKLHPSSPVTRPSETEVNSLLWLRGTASALKKRALDMSLDAN